MPTVVLDAGHGGYDYGAVNGQRFEKNDNLKMALAVGNLLRDCGFNVIYTRSTDVFIPLLERANISNRANADLFISFHRNSSTNTSAHGFENWIYTNASAKSAAAANYILDRVVAVGVQSNRGIKYGNFVVLRETNAPAVLIENGFISNTEDNRLFDANFNAYAAATANGIARTFDRTCVPGVTPPAPPPPPPPGYKSTVMAIQQRLNSQYGANLTVDGIWGPVSNRALIRAFQTELNRMYNAGLVTDGVWGPSTRAATRPVRPGDRNNLVWILQAALYINGFPTTPDGSFGPNTELTLRNFQRAKGLTVDGVAGANTFETVFIRGGF